MVKILEEKIYLYTYVTDSLCGTLQTNNVVNQLNSI